MGITPAAVRLRPTLELSQKGGLWIKHFFTISLAVPLAAVSIATSHPHKHHIHRYHPKNPGCHTLRCDRHVGRIWWEKHKPRFQFRPFELCVANREAGSPGSYSYNTINWQYNGDYEGAYNWENSTWISMGGGQYAAHAYDATPEQQTLVFRAHANSKDWPQTVPACGG